MATRRPQFYRAGLIAMGSLLLAGVGARAAWAQEGRPTDAPAQEAGEDLTGLSIEQLMDVEVVSASKFRQKSAEAPSSVTVITADDIKAFGYKTLAEVLSSVRGMYVSYDRFFNSVGVRGFAPPGDYNHRILLLVDGYRTNDPVYDTAAISESFIVDLDLVERIEIVRGPGSAVYGSNAFFAVVNVITKKGADIDGLRLSAGAASFGVDRESAAFGRQFANGASVLVSATRMRRDGRDLYFPEFDAPETNNGVADDLDWTRLDQVFGKIEYGGLTLTASHAKRGRGLPAAPFGIAFNEPGSRWIDRQTIVGLGHHGELGARWSLNSRLVYGRYASEAEAPLRSDPSTLIREESRGEWWGGELQALGRFGGHTLTVGSEYQDNLHQDQETVAIDPAMTLAVLDDRRSSRRLGVYAEDEIVLSSSLRLNAGVRYDRYSGIGDTLNPRAALIWNPGAATTVKAVYGSAFRAPNALELFYNDGGIAFKANPNLKAETIKTYELVLEHYFDPQTRLTVDAYYNDLTDVIIQLPDPVDGLLVYQNAGGARTKGAEVELERVWANGARLRASYAWQTSRTKGSHLRLADSPTSLAKLNVSLPVFDRAARVAAEMQYMSRRLTMRMDTVAPHVVANLTVSTNRLPGGIELSAGVYNLFDTEYSDPAGGDLVQDKIRQDGRSFRIGLSRTF